MEERTYVRTIYGRSDARDVMTKPKFFALIGLLKSLRYGALLARALRRAWSSAKSILVLSRESEAFQGQ